MKYALDAIGDQTLVAAGSHRADLADDRDHQPRAVRRGVRLAGDVSGVRESGVARRGAGVQSVQVQLVSGQRRAAIVSAGARAAAADRSTTRATGRLAELPPILTFQSVVDFTVSTRAIVDALYVHLPANGSELVLFDLNRSAKFGPLLRSGADTALAGLLPATAPAVQDYGHHQRQPGDQRDGRARDRSRGGRGADPRAGAGVSGRACSRCRTSPCRFRSTIRCTACNRIRPRISASTWARWRCGESAER